MKIDYTDKTLYIGIDVHKKTYVLHCICDKSFVKKWSMRADQNQLIAQLEKYFSGATIYTAYEAGFSGFVLHRALLAAGINNIVVNPGSIEIASRDRVKTDKRDAKKIAEQLSDGRLACIYIPTVKEELSRLYTRHRVRCLKHALIMICNNVI